jgi:CheY-like chemotaxis protein
MSRKLWRASGREVTQQRFEATIGEQGLPQLTRILVVDDFEPFRRFACSLLQQMAVFEVAEAADGLEAVQKAKELSPELILLDIGLPRLNGIEVANGFRALVRRQKSCSAVKSLPPMS